MYSKNAPYFMCTPYTDIPLTPSNVVRLMRELRKWWKREFELSLVDCLFIPRSKQDKIRDNFPDEMDQKKQAMSFWINTDPLVSWRTLITALDRMSETKLADSIRFNAEPLTGTVYSVGYSSQHTIWISLYGMPSGTKLPKTEKLHILLS